MADSFFGFDAALPSHEDDAPLEGEEEEYDALNDETFGEDTFEEDWEQNHEKLAEITESSRVHRNSYNEPTNTSSAEDEEDGLVSGSAAAQLEASLNRMVLEDFDPLSPIKARPPPTFPSTLPTAPWPSTPPIPPPPQSLPPPSLPPHSQPPPQVQQVLPQTNGTVSGQSFSALSIINHMAAMQQKPRVPSVRTVEELERDLRARSSQQQQQQQQQQRPSQEPETRLANISGPEQSFGQVVSPTRDPQKQQQQRTSPQQIVKLVSAGGLVDLINAAVSGMFPRPPPPPPHLAGRGPPPHFIPPNKSQFSHPPPPSPGMLPPGGQFRPFPPPPHGLPPPSLMSQPPPNFPPRMPLQNRGEFPFPWMHHPPPPHPPPPNHPNFQQQQQHEQQRIQEQLRHRQNGVHDPYAGLMSGKDKQWLINIQILQLNSQKPYIDDFYYTAFQLKQQLARERAGEKGVNVLRREQRTLEPRAYTPAQFEGSLGKLQVVSVTAPRKIIDMDLVSSESSDLDKPTRDSRRTKQTLLELERLYLLVLQLEDLVHPMAEARASVLESKEDLVAKVLSTINPPGGEDKLPTYMCVRKGKTLLQRILPHLTWSQQTPLWRSVLRGFWSISRRDTQDQLLPELFPAFRDWSNMAVLPNLLVLANALLPNLSMERTSSPINNASRNPLPAALTNKFGVSAIASMINRAGDLSGKGTPPPAHPEWQDWSSFISSLADAAADLPLDICTPIEPLRVPTSHLVHLPSKPGLALQRALGVATAQN